MRFYKSTVHFSISKGWMLFKMTWMSLLFISSGVFFSDYVLHTETTPVHRVALIAGACMFFGLGIASVWVQIGLLRSSRRLKKLRKGGEHQPAPWEESHAL
jgi:hypothetical protein